MASVRRVTARHIAAAIVQCMADTDSSFEFIAGRIGVSDGTVRQWLHDLIEGKTGQKDIEHISDMAVAMSAQLVPMVRPYEPPRSTDISGWFRDQPAQTAVVT